MFTFCTTIIIFQVRFISLNTTTSEELRRESVPIPNFDTGSISKNWSIFFKNMLEHKNSVSYNESALQLINKNKLLVEYLFDINNTQKHKSDLKKNPTEESVFSQSTIDSERLEKTIKVNFN